MEGVSEVESTEVKNRINRVTAAITSLKLTRREELGKVAQLVRQRGVAVVNTSVRSLLMETLCGEWLQAVFMV